MKHWLWYALAIAVLAALGFAPFQGTDVAKLSPVELIRVSEDAGFIRVETDGGDLGVGADPDSAFADLKRKAAGEVFLETAEYLLIDPALTDQMSAFGAYLRPACAVCMEFGEADMETAAKFLSIHKPEVTLQDIRAGENALPALITWEGRMQLVQ